MSENIFIFLIGILIILQACTPNPKLSAVQTAIAKTDFAQESQTSTYTIAPSNTNTKCN